MKFPKIIRSSKTKIEVVIYGRSKGGDPKKDGTLTQPYPFYRVVWRAGGQRRMQSFGTYSAALDHAHEMLRELGKGSQTTVLTPGQAADALAAFERLQGYFQTTGRSVTLLAGISQFCEAAAKLKDVSLATASDGYLGTVAAVRRMDIAKAAQEFIDVRKPLTLAKEGRRPQLSAGYNYNFNMWLREFADCFPGNAVSDLTTDHLDLYFRKFAELSSKSRNERRGVVRMFLQWAARRDYLQRNGRLLEADGMKREVYEPDEIAFYSAGELSALLEAADDSMRPMIALVALGGVRLQEASRLAWADVFHVADHLEITGGKSKTRARRLIPVCPALADWLEPYRNQSGNVWTQSLDKFHNDFAALLGLLKIAPKRNGLRHGFCTFHLAANGNENLTAQMAGNSPTMLHGNYKGLATRKEGEAWFDVKPESPANVLPMPATAVNA